MRLVTFNTSLDPKPVNPHHARVLERVNSFESVSDDDLHFLNTTALRGKLTFGPLLDSGVVPRLWRGTEPVLDDGILHQKPASLAVTPGVTALSLALSLSLFLSLSLSLSLCVSVSLSLSPPLSFSLTLSLPTAPKILTGYDSLHPKSIPGFGAGMGGIVRMLLSDVYTPQHSNRNPEPQTLNPNPQTLENNNETVGATFR